MSEREKYRNVVAIAWLFSPVLYSFSLMYFGVPEKWSICIAISLWFLSAFPMAKITNLL